MKAADVKTIKTAEAETIKAASAASMKTLTDEPHVFGPREPGVQYTQRLAAYVVVFNAGGEVAAVVGSRQKHFLPGGGSLPGEGPEQAITREVSEELGRGVRLTRSVGEALQYFYSEADERHYEMRATFFAGEFTEGPGGAREPGACEHELRWLPASEAEGAFFHACHAWAARRGFGGAG